MMPDLITAVGAAAAICTSVSYSQQVKQTRAAGETGDSADGVRSNDDLCSRCAGTSCTYCG